MDEKVEIHVGLTGKEDRKSFVVVPIDVSEFESFIKWYNKGKNDNLNDEYVKVINSLKLAFDEEFSYIHCSLTDYRTGACATQVGPFTFYNYWKLNEFGTLLNEIPKREDYNSKRDNSSIMAASELKEKHVNDIKFEIMPNVTIGVYNNTGLIKLKQLKNDVTIFDKDKILYNKLFPSYIKPILVGLGGVLVSLFVGYVAHILANPKLYNQEGGSKKRFSGGNSIQDLINGINQTNLTDDQKNELGKITTVEKLKDFIDTNIQKLTPEQKIIIQEELKNKLSREQKKIINKDFPGFDLKDDDTVFGFLGEKFLGGKQGGKPLTKRHRKKRQNKKRKSRKSKK